MDRITLRDGEAPTWKLEAKTHHDFQETIHENRPAEAATCRHILQQHLHHQVIIPRRGRAAVIIAHT